jgi:hypothetical protein
MIETLNPSGEKTVCNSAVEASVYVLKLEVGRYRPDLANIDTNVRNCLKLGPVQGRLAFLRSRAVLSANGS